MPASFAARTHGGILLFGGLGWFFHADTAASVGLKLLLVPPLFFRCFKQILERRKKLLGLLSSSPSGVMDSISRQLFTTGAMTCFCSGRAYYCTETSRSVGVAPRSVA